MQRRKLSSLLGEGSTLKEQVTSGRQKLTNFRLRNYRGLPDELIPQQDNDEGRLQALENRLNRVSQESEH